MRMADDSDAITEFRPQKHKVLVGIRIVKGPLSSWPNFRGAKICPTDAFSAGRAFATRKNLSRGSCAQSIKYGLGLHVGLGRMSYFFHQSDIDLTNC